MSMVSLLLLLLLILRILESTDLAIRLTVKWLQSGFSFRGLSP